jgi:hypothetical protein
MKAIFKEDMLILVPDGEQETLDLAQWESRFEQHEFVLTKNPGSGVMLRAAKGDIVLYKISSRP